MRKPNPTKLVVGFVYCFYKLIPGTPVCNCTAFFVKRTYRDVVSKNLYMLYKSLLHLHLSYSSEAVLEDFPI